MHCKWIELTTTVIKQHICCMPLFHNKILAVHRFLLIHVDVRHRQSTKNRKKKFLSSQMIGKSIQNSSENSLIKWVFTISRAFGYWPLLNDSHHKNRKARNAYNSVWLLAVIAIYIFCAVCASKAMSRFPFTSAEILLLQFTTTVYGSTPFISVILNRFNRSDLRNMIVSLNEFDQKVSSSAS